ncbi:hypothetical protein PR048_019257 [Dryococelus australis]|uniref:Clathrin/coatomer adaptor adaptin-like N-terminal domain-containing protein n=1 Tax=Dryococelus australis TaxID=614101 RepID=A0ABQ9H309_9NEOP|nr:hypothetical protein PR048_019257 [Dryococelus australis]
MALERKNALKKAIVGADGCKSAQKLFPEVLGYMHTDNLELKKLAQLYVLRCAPELPNVAIMAINTLVMDFQSNEPLVRARALRTMGYMRLDVMPDHLGEPLYKALHDQDDYVRKTAAICVAKLHAMSPEAICQFGPLLTY